MNIYTKVERQPTLYEYLKECFNTDSGNFVETFTDKDCTTREFRKARRSFEDLWEISKTLYPKCSEKALSRILFKLNTNDNLYGYLCSTAKKVVFKRQVNGVHRNMWGSFSPAEMNDPQEGKYSAQQIDDLYIREIIE
jgi:hypothetical protein